MDSVIPTVDLSPFFSSEKCEEGKKNAIDTITKACSDYGFFQIVNHGVPVDVMKKALNLSRKFFSSSNEDKLKCSPRSDAPLPAGYSKQPDASIDKNEYLLMFPPGSDYNVYPQSLPEFQVVAEETFKKLAETGLIIETILNESLGLLPNFLKDYNQDRNWDFMVALRYFPADKNTNNGISEHEDGNCITFVFQDDVGGLEVCKDGVWIPVVPAEGRIVVNIGDVIQVISNKKFKSATHRVVRKEGKSRYSYAFFYNLQGDKYVEPLPQFTKEMGESPKYKGFLYKDYQQLRLRNKTHPPASQKDVIDITHYAI